jgi:SAM-dependent methyltransferase
MKSNDKKKIIERYEGRLKQFGPKQKALGWLKGRQKFRFYFLEQISDSNENDSILDVGCAYADLYGYLKEQGWNGKYCGVDIVPGLIDEAKKRYPGVDARIGDILEDNFTEKYDWIYCSGALTSKTEDIDSYDHLEAMLNKMFEICNKGVSVNFCSPVVDFESEVNFHPQFDRLIKMILKLSKRFTIRHDYMPYEFTVYIYKDETVNKDANIFSAKDELYKVLKVNDED